MIRVGLRAHEADRTSACNTRAALTTKQPERYCSMASQAVHAAPRADNTPSNIDVDSWLAGFRCGHDGGPLWAYAGVADVLSFWSGWFDGARVREWRRGLRAS